MARPGFVLEVDEATPALLTVAGAQPRLQRLGRGTRVVYPADALPSQDPVTLIDAAMDAPLEADPLEDQLRPGMRLTVVVADQMRPLPRMRFDIRRSIVERVLQRAARRGVDDVELVIASGLNRRWSARDVFDVLGERVVTSFLPDGLVTSHNVIGDDLTEVGEVDGHPVQLNARVAASDLVVVVTTCDSPEVMPTFATGLTDVDTINRICGLRGDTEAVRRVEEVCASVVPVFHVVATLGQPLMGRRLSFMDKREWEWGLRDQMAFAGARQLVAALPRQGSRRLFGDPVADYQVLDLLGGAGERVQREAAEVWRAANAVELEGQADVLVTSVWGAAFDRHNPEGTPLGAAHHALVEQLGCHLERPVLREGGTLVAFHPLTPRFSNRTQASAADFFATVLPKTLDPKEIAEHHEPGAVADPWYQSLYRDHNASHPLSVFHAWYRLQRAMQHVGEVIWVGADRHSAAVLGHRVASSYADALELASANVGQQPDVTFLRGPGRVLGVVR